MSFVFDATKALQAAAYLVKLDPAGRVHIMALLKYLYIADRDHLRERGIPITGDVYSALPRGPICSQIYDLLKSRIDQALTEEEILWAQHLSREKHHVLLEKDPGEDRLSRAEKQRLHNVFESHMHMDPFTLSDKTHEFPEWEKNRPIEGQGRGSRSIPLRDIVEAIGRGDLYDEIEARRADEQQFSALFEAH